MPDFTILYDAPQEAEWFCSLHAKLADAQLVNISDAPDLPGVNDVLSYDRPDIVLLDGENPVLVVEETTEVPSGHNPGQRFARIVAAAEAGVPVLYFVPYVAMKHGGETAGPRYMNLRLFRAIDALQQITGTTITTVNWPVSENFEVLRGQEKDSHVRDYIATFLALYATVPDLESLNGELFRSYIHTRLINERQAFIRTLGRRARRYDKPPPTVMILTANAFRLRHGLVDGEFQDVDEMVVYRVGMRRIRSDPYTGMALFYKYLYILGEQSLSRALVLWFPNIEEAEWRRARASGDRKDVRLYSIAADAIIFSDRLVVRKGL